MGLVCYPLTLRPSPWAESLDEPLRVTLKNQEYRSTVVDYVRGNLQISAQQASIAAKAASRWERFENVRLRGASEKVY